ncbi:MAG TPA: signal peptidase II [Polyangia bacterium]|nr:signal peptidase II [Polyangia bacterium]
MIDRRRLVFLFSAAFALAFDQLTKVWARHALLPIYPRVKTVIPGIWEFRYSENPGAAFGLLRNVPGAHYFFVPIALGIAVGAFLYVKRAQLRHPTRVPMELGLIVGGALGNAIDRVFLGRVTDFVVWRWHQHEWDTFNIADAALVVGIIGLLLDTGSPKTKTKATARAAAG